MQEKRVLAYRLAEEISLNDLAYVSGGQRNQTLRQTARISGAQGPNTDISLDTTSD